MLRANAVRLCWHIKLVLLYHKDNVSCLCRRLWYQQNLLLPWQRRKALLSHGLVLLYHKITILSILFHKVAGSRLKDSKKGVMVKKGGTPKNTKSPWFTRTFVLGCKIVDPLCARRIKLQLVKSRRKACISSIPKELHIINTKCCISSSRRKMHADAWWDAKAESRLWWYTDLGRMIYQACGLDKKIPSQ